MATLFTATTATTLLVACLLHIAASFPSGPTPTMQFEPDSPKCSSFDFTYCNSFGYSRSMFPNARQMATTNRTAVVLSKNMTYEQEAINQFLDFSQLMNSACSNKLGTLLCFLYFPYCQESESTGEVKTVYPCRHTCEEITDPESECTKELDRLSEESGFDLSWGPQFNCNEKSVYKDNDCAGGLQESWIPGVHGPNIFQPTEEEPAEDSDEDTTEDTEEETTEETKEDTEEETTEETREDTPTEEMCSPCTAGEYKCKNCNIRKGFSSQTLKSSQNSDYNYAFKGTLNSFTTYHCKSALNFTVQETFDIKRGTDCSVAPEIEVGSTVLTLGSDISCDENCFRVQQGELKLEENKTFLVVGHYRREEDSCNSIFWELEGSKESVIVPWKAKLSQKIRKATKATNDLC